MVVAASLVASSGGGENVSERIDADPVYAIAHITVHKTPTCGCCAMWVDHVRSEGFSVTVHDHSDLTAIRSDLGIPGALASCHSAQVNGYSLEGHVPASDIKRLLSERPDAVGLSVPGMPASAPGMDVEGVEEPFATLLFNAETAKVYSRHDGGTDE